jgi:hypothetical protein
MKTLSWFAATVGMFLAAAAIADDKKLDNKLPDAVAKALEKADEVELLSLNGERDATDGWRGSKVLGKTTVKKEADRKSLASAVKKGVEEGKDGSRCFIPRHGIRVTHEKKTYDLVICFECHWVYVYTEGSDKPLVLMTSDSAQKTLNKFLTDAKVPLAKPEKDEKK